MSISPGTWTVQFVSDVEVTVGIPRGYYEIVNDSGGHSKVPVVIGAETLTGPCPVAGQSTD